MNRTLRRRADNERRKSGGSGKGPSYSGRDRDVVRSELANIEQLLNRKQIAAARAACAETLRLTPRLPEAHCFMGLIEHEAGNRDLAVSSYKKSLALFPQFFVAWMNLGLCLREMEDHAGAVDAYRKAIAIAPDSAQAWGALGSVHTITGDFDNAVKAYQSAVANEPDSEHLNRGLASVLRLARRHHEALEYYEKLLAKRPDWAHAHAAHGSCLQELGRFEEAEACFWRALELKADNASAYLGLSVQKLDAEKTQKLRDGIGKLSRRIDIPQSSQIDLGFAAGRIHERNRDHDQAFKSYMKANTARRAIFPFDRTKLEEHVDRIIEIFDDALIEKLSAHGDSAAKPVFIVGMPRSGTTLIEQILSSHAQVAGAGEVPEMGRIARTVAPDTMDDDEFARRISKLRRKDIAAHAEQYLSAAQKIAGEAAHITDKMPQNFFHVGLVRILFPNATLIHSRRNPVDTCLSCFFQNFMNDAQAFSFDLADTGFFYTQYDRLMAHWKSLEKTAIADIVYEDLIADQEPVVRKMIAHCGLEWDPACLSAHKTERPIQTASMWQARQPIYKTSSGKWKAYETYLEPLKAELGPLWPAGE